MRWARRIGSAVLLIVAPLSLVPSVMAVVAYGWVSVPPLALQVLLIVAAALILRLPAHRRDGWWVLGAAVLLGVNQLDQEAFYWGYWVMVAYPFTWAAGACLVPPLLRFPDHPASDRDVRWLTGAAWVALVVPLLLNVPFWNPSMNGYEGPVRWLTIYPWEAAARFFPKTLPWLVLPMVVAYTFVQWRRLRTVAGPSAGTVRAMAWLSLVLGLVLWARITLEVLEVAWELRRVTTIVHLTATSAAVLAIIGIAVVGTVRRASYVEEVIAAGGRAPEIERVLRRHLADPTLRLRFLTDEGWTNADGTPAAATPDRAHYPVVLENDVPVVEVELDPRLEVSDSLVRSLLESAGVLLANARLSVQQAAAAIELRESRARIVEAAVQQRRRLERDLHDGAQQHLLAAQAALSRAELLSDGDSAAGAALVDVRSRLTSTMTELRGLARGLHPALLSQAGLSAALTSLSEQSDRVVVTVDPSLVGRRFAPIVEATAWYMASEAVVNALRHGGTDEPERDEVSVWAGLVRSDDEGILVCRVSDQGGGGAVYEPGGGLAGLRDRVRATGGTFTVVSEPGRGTTVEARLPVLPPEAGS